jgi:hypothetical protein
MSEVLISSLPWGVVQNGAGEAQVAAPYTITLVDNTPVASGLTNGFGEIPGTLPTGIYKVTVMGRTKIIHVWETDETVGGSAITGAVLSPTFVTDMATQAELDVVNALAAAAKKFRTGHTWALGGPLTAGMFVPRIAVPKITAQAVQFISVRHRIISGTSITIQLVRNGSNLGSTFNATTTPTSTSVAGMPVTLADLDDIYFALSAPSATPADLSLTAIFEHTI